MNKIERHIGSPALNASRFISSASSSTRSALTLSNRLFNTQTSSALTALGLTSLFRTVSGTLAAMHGLKEIETAQKTDDTVRKILGQLKVAQGGIGAAGGFLSIPGQISFLTSSPFALYVGRLCAMVGRKLVIVGSVLGGVAQGIRLHEHRIFREHFYAILNDSHLEEKAKYTHALAYLKTFVSISHQEKEAIQLELSKDPTFSQLSLEEQREKVTIKEQALLVNKKSLIRRILDQHYLNLIERAGASEAREVVEAVEKKSFSRLVDDSMKMGIAVIGLGLGIASLIFTGGVAGLIIAGAGFLLSARSLVINTIELIDGFKNGAPGRFDKLWLVAWTIAGIAATTIILISSPPLIVMVGATLLGSVWLGVTAAAYYKTHQTAAVFYGMSKKYLY